MATEFECDHCGATASHRERPAVYALDGVDFLCEPVSAHSRPAWCRNCESLVDAEHLLDVNYYETQLFDFQSPDLSASDRELVSMTQRSESEFRESIANAWRIAKRAARDRKSPPRCFTCGTTDIFFIAGYDSDSHELPPFPHPDCAGTFNRTGCSYPNFEILYLDAEGRRRNA